MKKFLIGAGTVLLVLWVLNKNAYASGGGSSYSGPPVMGGQNVSFATGGDPSNPAAPFANVNGTAPAQSPTATTTGCGCGPSIGGFGKVTTSY